MIPTFNRLKTIFPHLNEKPVSVEEFYFVANRRQIEIFELKLKKRGYCIYDRSENQNYLFIKKGLAYLQWREVAFHEFFHTLGCTEFEANAFRLVAMIPLPQLMDYSFLEEFPTFYAKRLFREREKLWFLYRI